MLSHKTTIYDQRYRFPKFGTDFKTEKLQNPANIRQNPTDRRQMTSSSRNFTKTSGNFYFIDILTVFKDDVSSATRTENMTSIAFLA